MKTKPILILCTIILFSFSLLAQDKKAADEKLTFTKEEFKKAVMSEVESKLKKVTNANLVEFSKELLKREEELKLKELETQKQDEQLKKNITSFEKRLKEFQERQTKFLGCIDEKDKKQEDRVKHMVSVISGMKPKTAADVLSVQDSGISVQILGLLDPAKVSKIFNLMDKEISARLQKQYMTMKK